MTSKGFSCYHLSSPRKSVLPCPNDRESNEDKGIDAWQSISTGEFDAREVMMKLVATKEITFSSGRHHVIQTSQIPAYFDKGKPKERRILIMMQSKHSNSMGKVQKVFILCVGRSGIKISMHIFRGCVGVGIFCIILLCLGVQ